MDVYIAVDIGGTQLRAAVFPAGEMKPSAVRKLATNGDGEEPLARLLRLLHSVIPQKDTVRGIALAAPGPANGRAGIIYRAPNIPGWINLPLAQIVEDEFKIRTLLGNDADMAALGEWKYGAARGHSDVIYITVSTGIGAGIITDNRLLEGASGLAGELGHTTIVEDGLICSCGHPGHVEAYASGTAISRFVEEEIAKGTPSALKGQKKITAKEVNQAAQAGDELAIRAFERAGLYLGRALGDFLHLINPSIVVIGGGVSHAGELLFKPLREAMSTRIIAPEYMSKLEIVPAALGDDAGLIGTLVLAQS